MGETIEENGNLEAYARNPDGNRFSLLQTGPAAAVKVADLQQIDATFSRE